MDRSNVITLLSNARSQDATGVWRDGEETQREIFCQVDSVSRKSDHITVKRLVTGKESKVHLIHRDLNK